MSGALNPALQEAKFCPRCGQPADVAYPRSISCPHCGYGAYYNPKPVAAAIPVTPDDKIVLLRRGFDPGKGLWTFPGGFVDLGETVEEAARREAREEIQVSVELGALVGVYSRGEERVVLIVYARDDDRSAPDHGRSARGPGLRTRRDPLGGPRLLVDDERAEGLPQRRITLTRYSLSMWSVPSVATFISSYSARISARQASQRPSASSRSLAFSVGP